MRTCAWLYAAALFLGGYSVPSVHGQTTWYVDGANCPGPGTGSQADPFCTIQAGMVGAMIGDTVIVADGIYTGAGNKDLDFGGKAITLRSANGAGSCIIDCEDDGRGFSFLSGETPATVLDGFTITAGYAYTGAGIRCGSSCSPTIKNCIISRNSATLPAGGNVGGGIYCGGTGADPAIINCTITGNISGYYGGGIGSTHRADPTIINCTITGNFAYSSGGGIYSYYYSDPTLTNCIVWNNSWGQISGPATVTYSDIEGSWAGEGNIDVDPVFAFADDPYLLPGSPCIDAGTNTPPGGLPQTDDDGNPRPLDGDGDGILVADMGAHEYNAQEPSIALSPHTAEFFGTVGGPDPDDQVLSIRNSGGGTLNWQGEAGCAWLQPVPSTGTSTGEVDDVTLQVDITGLEHGKHFCPLMMFDEEAVNGPRWMEVTLFLSSTLHVPAEYQTIQAAIDAALPSDDIVLVADGTYTGPDNKNLDFAGKAITVRSENGPETCIIDCESDGRGFYLHSREGPDAVVSGFTITNGSVKAGGGGAIYLYNSSPTISNCRITGNSASWGGGLYFSNPSDPTIIDCTITGNSASWGGGIYCSGSDATLTNCTISDNSADWGGGIGCGSSSPIITNCTITGNTASTGGGILYENSGTPTILNSILWGNTATDGSEIALLKDPYHSIGCPTLTVSFSDIQGGQSALYLESSCAPNWVEGNIDADPRFIDQGAGDLLLSPGSPAIDAADNGALPTQVTTDLGGNPRFYDDPFTANTGNGIPPIVDMGAYEHVDCNGNGIRDDQDIVAGTSEDCTGNGAPDECEPDCNTNAVADSCDIAVGTSEDCTGNSIPDECEPDCNNNAVADSCDILNGIAEDVNANGVPDQCDPVIYVRGDATGANNGTSWADAYRDMQDALGAALPGDHVWVALGTYRPDRGSGDREATFQLISRVAIYGGFAGVETRLDERNPSKHVTILSGDLAGNDGPAFANYADNSYHVVSAGEVYASAVLDGFTITAGNADGYVYYNWVGGGLYNLFGSPTVTNCTFMGNLAVGGGGMYNLVGDPTLTNLTFTGNLADGSRGGTIGSGGGVYSYHHSNPTLTNCTFTDNSAFYAGGMYSYKSNPTLTNCTFSANLADSDGAGMFNYYYSTPLLINCTFSGNQANGSGGGIYNYYFSSPTFINCMFTGNRTDRAGAGIHNFNSSTILTNCTFSGNRAQSSGGGIYNFDNSSAGTNSIITLTNSILWNNVDINGIGESAQLFLDSGVANVNYSCIEGLSSLTGNGNIADDPLFIYPSGPDGIVGTPDDNLRLMPGSPAIDTGDPAYDPGPDATDLDGNPRILNGDGFGWAIVDMGAYESPEVSAPDCNANGIPDDFDIADGTSDDCNANDIPDECEPDCNGNGIPDDCDIADAISADDNGNGFPDECERKNRYISFAHSAGAEFVAYQVTLTASLEFLDAVGLTWWLDAPGENGVSRLVGSPVYRSWIDDPSVIHVGDCQIVPVATFEIRSTTDGTTFSDPVEIATIRKPGSRYYGDVVGTGTGYLPPLPGFTPPNGVVNVSDVQAYRLTVQGPSTPSVHTTWVDLYGVGDGSPPDFVLNVSDLHRILFGFQGQRYGDAPDHMNPADCP